MTQHSTESNSIAAEITSSSVYFFLENVAKFIVSFIYIVHSLTIINNIIRSQNFGWRISRILVTLLGMGKTATALLYPTNLFTILGS